MATHEAALLCNARNALANSKNNEIPQVVDTVLDTILLCVDRHDVDLQNLSTRVSKLESELKTVKDKL